MAAAGVAVDAGETSASAEGIGDGNGEVGAPLPPGTGVPASLFFLVPRETEDGESGDAVW